jgi:hypothetical protein
VPTTFTAADATQYGVSRRELQRMLATGEVERVGRGLYRRTDSAPLDYDLVEIAARAYKATLCPVSALARHELTDIIPATHDLTLPRGAWQPRTSALVHWHTFDRATFELGRNQISVDNMRPRPLQRSPHHRGRLSPAPRSRPGGCKRGSASLAASRRRAFRTDAYHKLSFPAAEPPILHALQVLTMPA